MAAPGHNPFETPRPRGVRLLQGALRVIVAAQCFGMAASTLHLQQRDLFCQMMGKARELPVDQVVQISAIAAYILIGAGVLTLLRPATLILLPLIIYQSGTALATLLDGGADAQLAPALQATRIAMPLALMLVDFWPPRIKPSLSLCLGSMALLRLATAITFIAHAYLCLEQSRAGGALLDLFTAAIQKSMNPNFTAEHGERGLAILGGLEFGLAFALLTGRSRVILLASGVVGLFSAFLYTLADPQNGYAQSLMRISQVGAPLAILIFQSTAVKEQRPLYLAEQTHIAEQK